MGVCLSFKRVNNYRTPMGKPVRKMNCRWWVLCIYDSLMQEGKQQNMGNQQIYSSFKPDLTRSFLLGLLIFMKKMNLSDNK